METVFEERSGFQNPAWIDNSKTKSCCGNEPMSHILSPDRIHVNRKIDKSDDGESRSATMR